MPPAQRPLLRRAGTGAAVGLGLNLALSAVERLAGRVRKSGQLACTVLFIGSGAGLGAAYHAAQRRYHASRLAARPPSSLPERLLRWLFGGRPRPRTGSGLPSIPEQRATTPPASSSPFVSGGAGVTYADIALLQPPAADVAASPSAGAAAQPPLPPQQQQQLTCQSTDSVGGWSHVGHGGEVGSDLEVWSTHSRDSSPPPGTSAASSALPSAQASPTTTAAPRLAGASRADDPGSSYEMVRHEKPQGAEFFYD